MLEVQTRVVVQVPVVPVVEEVEELVQLHQLVQEILLLLVRHKVIMVEQG